MECVACVNRTGNTKTFSLVYGAVGTKMTGYFSLQQSKEILDYAKKNQVLNYIEHKGERTSHLLLQPIMLNKNSMTNFRSSQYCVGIAKGLRDRKDPKNFFSQGTKYVDASAQSIKTGKPMITLVPEMNLSHALNASQVMNVLKCIINKAGVKIEDILIFNLTMGDFWCLTSI